MMLSNLNEGIYIFQFTVTDTADQEHSINITVTVLNSDQTVGKSFVDALFSLESKRVNLAFAVCQPRSHSGFI